MRQNKSIKSEQVLTRSEGPSRAAGVGILGDLSRIFGGELTTGLSERQLIDRFVELGDDAAFEIIVRRHGPMVRAVCRSVLPNADDDDDAFQAIFLVLARKAHSLRQCELVGPWLCGVASQISRKAKVANARQGVPLKIVLWLMLRQLELAYMIKDGVLIISSPSQLASMLEENPVFSGTDAQRIRNQREALKFDALGGGGFQ